MLTLLRLPQTKLFEPVSGLADGLRFALARMPICTFGAERGLIGLRHPLSCPAAWRERQGQALRALRGLDTAGRRRAIGRAGSEGMPLTSPRELDRQSLHISSFDRACFFHQTFLSSPL